MDYTVQEILQARILEWVFPSSEDLPNSGMEPRSPHYRQIFYLLSHRGSPRILEWGAYAFSSPADLSNLGIELGFPALQVDSYNCITPL